MFELLSLSSSLRNTYRRHQQAPILQRDSDHAGHSGSIHSSKPLYIMDQLSQVPLSADVSFSTSPQGLFPHTVIHSGT